MTPLHARKRAFLLVVGCLGLLGMRGSLAQTPASPPVSAPLPTAGPAPVTTFKVTSREVQFDLLVTDAIGHPVTGLKPGDIQIEEDGVPQTIRSMDEHAPMLVAGPPTTNPTPPLPPNTFTNFAPVTNSNASIVLLLDALNSPIEAQMYLREQVIQYMKSVPPGTPIAIFQLDTQMRLIQGFTSDPEILRNAVASKRDMPKLSLLTDHNEVYRRYRSDILNAVLKEMGSYLAAYPGRKSLIWFTGSIPQNVYGSSSAFRDTMRYPADANLVGADVSAEELASATDTLTLSRVAVYPVDDRGLQTDPHFDAGSRHAGGGGTGFGVRQFYDHSALDNVAEATGGKAYYNTNGIKEAIAEIVNNGSYYYTIAYSTTNTNWDGAYRHIHVSTARSDLKLQYRRGYYARSYEKRERHQLTALQKRQASTSFNPDADAQPTQGAAIPKPKEGLPAAMTLGAVPPTELIFNASLAPSSKVERLQKNQPLPHDNYLRPEFKDKAYRDYQVLYLADAHKLKLARTPDGMRHGQVEFVAVVYDAGGEVVNSIQTSVEVTVNDSQYRQMLQGGFGMRQVVAIPVKGNYFLRLWLHDVAGDQVGALEIPVDAVKLGVAGAGQTLP